MLNGRAGTNLWPGHTRLPFVLEYRSTLAPALLATHGLQRRRELRGPHRDSMGGR
jgi:hypothetical protein